MQQHHWTREEARDIQESLDTVRDLHTVHGTKRDSERELARLRDSARHAATPWDQRDSER